VDYCVVFVVFFFLRILWCRTMGLENICVFWCMARKYDIYSHFWVSSI